MPEKGDLHVVSGGPLPYLVSVPAAPLASGDARPVLCFLHGYDEAALAGLHAGLTRHGPLRTGSSPRAVAEFVLVAPQLPRGGDLWYRYADAVASIIRDVRQTWAGDPRRTYLTGFSFGGNGVFDLALIRPDLWAALWPVDPTRVPGDDPGRPVWLSVGEVARHQKGAFVRNLQLEPAGVDTAGDRLYHDGGEDHVGSATSAYGDDRIYSWLLSKRLPPAGE